VVRPRPGPQLHGNTAEFLPTLLLFPGSEVALRSHWCGFWRHCPATPHSAFRAPYCPHVVPHKHPEYNPPLPQPAGWSGGTLDIPWTNPGTIHPLPDPVFDQARLSESASCDPFAGERRQGLAFTFMHMRSDGLASRIASESVYRLPTEQSGITRAGPPLLHGSAMGMAAGVRRRGRTKPVGY